MNARLRSGLLAALIMVLGLAVTPAQAAPGDLLATVDLPGNGTCSVAGTFEGTYYITVNTDSCFGTTLGIYTPPPASGAATLVSTKSVVDGGGNPVNISAVAWDPSRGMLWAGENSGAGAVYEIDIGDPTVSGNATATFRFAPDVGGFSLLDGMAYDASDDTLWYSPDVDCNVYHFDLPGGTPLPTVTPKNAAGNADCLVSGVVVGSANTLYIGRDGAAEIRRVDKTTGDFISQFATTSARVEDLTCDPVTYAPNEAVLAKDAHDQLYEAFEVEPGTCPLPREEPRPQPGRMTGGGSVFTEDGTRVTHGFQLHCDAAALPNNLQVNWGKGNRFHLESLDSASCSDDPAIDEGHPVAGFDTYRGSGTGRYNGLPGASAEWTFTDAGEPGSADMVELVVRDQFNVVVLTVTGTLNSGNHQAHPA